MDRQDAVRSDPRQLSARAVGCVGGSSAGARPGMEAMLVLVPAGQRARTPAPSRKARAWMLVLAGTGTVPSHHGRLVLRAGQLIRLSPLSGPVGAGPGGLAYLLVTAAPTCPTTVSDARRRGAGCHAGG